MTQEFYRNEHGIFVENIKGEEVVVKRSFLLHAAMRRIAAQFPAIPEARLMLGIINQAVIDTLDPTHRQEAIRYLQNDLHHALMCGINPEWIVDTLTELDCFEPLPITWKKWVLYSQSAENAYPAPDPECSNYSLACMETHKKRMRFYENRQ